MWGTAYGDRRRAIRSAHFPNAPGVNAFGKCVNRPAHARYRLKRACYIGFCPGCTQI